MPATPAAPAPAGAGAPAHPSAAAGASAQDLAAQDLDVASRLRTTVGRLSRRLRRTRSGEQLTPSQHDVLGTIVRHGPVRLSDLAAAEGINPTMLSRIAGKLEDAGLVARSVDPRDGRVAHLAATPTGARLWSEIRSERTDALARALSRLPEEERRRLAAALPVLESLAESLKDSP